MRTFAAIVRRLAARRGARPARSRGATLLVAITAIAILTAAATELAYNVRVSLEIAVNARDELRATYLAKSAVNLSRMVLHFQRQLDNLSSSQSGTAGQTAANAQTGAQSLQSMLSGMTLNIHLWEVLPVDSGMIGMFLSGDRRSALTAPPEGAKSGNPSAFPAGGKLTSFGDFEGNFDAKIEDEDRKINVPQLAGLALSTTLPATQLMRLQQLISDPVYDPLFDREDANGVRVTRNDLLIALKDWVDEDEVGSSLTNNSAAPFEQGTADENYYYSRGRDSYSAKNARFDSLDELYLVAGVTDVFMAAFGDKLTVYPNVNQAINIDTSDPKQLYVNVLAMSDPPGIAQAPLLDPSFVSKFQAALMIIRPISLVPLKVQDVVAALTAMGIKVNPIYKQANAPSAAFTDRPPTTFHIRASGRAGKVEKTIDVVVSMDPRFAGVQANDMGRLIHWREE